MTTDERTLSGIRILSSEKYVSKLSLIDVFSFGELCEFGAFLLFADVECVGMLPSGSNAELFDILELKSIKISDESPTTKMMMINA